MADTALDKPKPRHPNQTPPALTRKRQADFLSLLAQTGQWVKSCEAIKVHQAIPYKWAMASEGFAKRLEEAKVAGEKVILSRYEGQMDAVCLADMALDEYAKVQNSRFFRMKKLDPRYRDNAPSVNIVTGALSIVSTLDEARPALPSKPDRQG